jgi:hypothetical protein
MQVHLRRSDAHWDQWVRGVAIVAALLVAPAAIALVWLTVVRGLLP